MSVLIKPSGLYWGIPDELPKIRGFKIEARAGEWLQARQQLKWFLVEKRRKGYRLWPWVNLVTRKDQCIYIPND